MNFLGPAKRAAAHDNVPMYLMPPSSDDRIALEEFEHWTLNRLQRGPQQLRLDLTPCSAFRDCDI